MSQIIDPGPVGRNMKVYRFLEEKYARELLDHGSIGISTTRSVAQIEGRQRDNLDAGISTRFSGHSFAGVAGFHPKQMAGAARAGSIVEPLAANCAVLHSELVLYVPGHILCFSRDPYSKAFPGKDWVFEILDFVGFANCLTALSGGRLNPTFACSMVTYQQRVFDAMEPIDAEPHPFIKQASAGYEDEAEARIFWATEGHAERLTITHPYILTWLHLVRSPEK